MLSWLSGGSSIEGDSPDHLALAEAAMLRFFRLIATGAGGPSNVISFTEGATTHLDQRSVSYRSPLHVEVGKIHTLQLRSGEESSKPDLVLLHGYGAGSAFWVANLGPLSRHFNVHLLDLPGFGRSSRHAVQFDEPEQALDYMLDAIHDWKLELLPNKSIYLAGHSFGAYLAGHYALRHAKEVNHLLLLDAWGMAEQPVKPQAEIDAESYRWRAIKYVSSKVSPFSLLRALPEGMAKSLILRTRGDIVDKFRFLFPDDAHDVIVNYIYACNVQAPALGEDIFRALSKPVAWAKIPLEPLLDDLSPEINLTVLCGDRTWMGTDSAHRVVAKRMSEPRSMSQFHLVPNSSHHIYIDNPVAFNELIAATRTVAELEKRKR